MFSYLKTLEKQIFVSTNNPLDQLSFIKLSETMQSLIKIFHIFNKSMNIVYGEMSFISTKEAKSHFIF
jgi:hypothetical protein